jgi:hypothetical protein
MAPRGQGISQFQEDPGGNQVFLSALCPTSFGEGGGELDNNQLKLDFCAIMYKPIPTDEDPRLAKDHSLKAGIINLIADKERFDRDVRPSLTRCIVRDEVTGRLTQQGLRSFIAKSEEKDQTIRFYRNYEDYKRAAGMLPLHEDLLQSAGLAYDCALERRPTGYELSMPDALRLDSIVLAYKKAHIQHTQGESRVVITTAPEQWAYAASIPIVPGSSPGWKLLIHVRGRVLKGQIGIGILNGRRNSFEREEFLSASATTRDFYIPIPDPAQASELIIRNSAATGTVSEIALDNVELLASR